jgi:hypothetical protein
VASAMAAQSAIGVGGPASSEEAAQRCTELNWPVGPTLIEAWGDRPDVKRPRSGVPN